MDYHPENIRILLSLNKTLSLKPKKHMQTTKEMSHFNIEDLQPSLQNVMKQIRAFVNFQEARGESEKSFIGHFLFIGPQGTGKTSAAADLANYLNHADFIESNKLIRVTRKDLVSENIGGTALKTSTVIEQAKGGVLFIDEAYTLFKGHDNSRDFGSEALETIMNSMEKKEVVFIMAGYRREINTLLTSNPGLEDRFKYKIFFDEITNENLVNFAEYLSIKKGYQLSKDGKDGLKKIIEDKRKNHNFAYLRTVSNLIDSLVFNKPKLFEETGNRKLLTEISYLDLEGIWRRVQEDELEEALRELDGLVGLKNVKETVKAYLNIVDYNLRRKKAGLEDTHVSSHMSFIGNPGTGKTTVARLVGKILGAKGYLSIGHVVEVTREDLVGAYLGSTAIKTREKIKEAKGGILFIDEAYSLVNGDRDTFGQEALDILVKDSEDYRGELLVILAGYQNEMRRLFKRNPGLKSRISQEVYFEDYTEKEFLKILENMFDSKGYTLERNSDEILKELSNTYYEKEGQSGNGRAARNLYEIIIKIHAQNCILCQETDLNEIKIKTLIEVRSQIKKQYKTINRSSLPVR